MRRFSSNEQMPENGQVRSKHVTVGVILMLIQVKEIMNSFKLH
jgi:hypothetical protein